MNVYDFDETVFTGDVEERFFKFMFAKKISENPYKKSD